ncbi:MAG: trimethylamine methyltransferase family protein, partial [Clostridia bacterium]
MSKKQMKFPGYFQILTPEEETSVHNEALVLLEEVGLEVNNEKAIGIFSENGCHTDKNCNRVTFPKEV